VLPVRIRLGMALWASIALYMGLNAPSVELPNSMIELSGIAFRETVMGLSGALAAKFMMDAASAAGQSAALSMGLGFGSVIDPSSGAESAAVGQLFSTVTLASAVMMGIHREALYWLASSFHSFPLASAMDISALAAGVVNHAILGIALAVRVCFPLLVAVTFGHGVLGLLGRAAPQLNVASVGFSVAILAGGGGIFLLTPAATQLCAQLALDAFRNPTSTP
jgi:flagellar biosynthetic protein FliR